MLSRMLSRCMAQPVIQEPNKNRHIAATSVVFLMRSSILLNISKTSLLSFKDSIYRVDLASIKSRWT